MAEDITTTYELEDLNYDCSDFEFGDYLKHVRQARRISIRQLAKAVNKTPTYLSDIENGNNKPPNKELLEKIIKELRIDDYPKLKLNLFDLAAIARNDVPADIKDYIKGQKRVIKILRKIKDNSNNEKIWSEIEKIIC